MEVEEAAAMAAAAICGPPAPARRRKGRPKVVVEVEAVKARLAAVAAEPAAEGAGLGNSIPWSYGTESEFCDTANVFGLGSGSSRNSGPCSSRWQRTSKREASTVAEGPERKRPRIRRRHRSPSLCAPGGSCSACPICTKPRTCSHHRSLGPHRQCPRHLLRKR